MAIAIVFRKSIAQKCIPPAFFDIDIDIDIDIDVVKESAVYPRDKVISSIYLFFYDLFLNHYCNGFDSGFLSKGFYSDFSGVQAHHEAPQPQPLSWMPSQTAGPLLNYALEK